MKNFTNGEWPRLFTITMWWIWRWRNDVVFNAVHLNDKTKTRWLREQYGEVKRAFNSINNTRRTSREEDVRWQKPKVRFIALNIDASVSRIRRTFVCGGILRDCAGNWVGGFMSKKEYGAVDFMQSWAVLEGLEFAWSRGIQYLEIQTDAQKVADRINKESKLQRPIHDIIHKCKDFINRDWEVTIKHVYREQNRVADKLAETTTYQRYAWRNLERSLEGVRQLIFEDKWGVSWPRNVLFL